MAIVNDVQSTAHGLTGRVSAFWKNLQESRQRRRVFVQTLRVLNALSTRELDDLGINRTMITRVAYEAAYGK